MQRDCNKSKLLIIAAMTVGLAHCGNDDTPEPPVNSGSFEEALTYNIAGLPESISSSSPETNIPQISPLLNAYDLVLVQEDFSYRNDLAKEATHPYQSDPAIEFDTVVGDGLNRFAQFAWTGFERQKWVSCFGDAFDGSGDCLASKGFSVARTTLADGIEVDIYNHHGEARGSDEDDDVREAGFDQLIAFIAEYSGDRAIIVAGDTNLKRSDPEDSPVLDALLEEMGLQDACTALACGSDEIDRFFFRSDSTVKLAPTSWRIADEFIDTDGAPLSDHPAM